MSDKLERYFRFMPKELKVRTNPMWRALLEAFASSDQEVVDQLTNTNAQLFVATAEGVYLDRLASNFGVSRPAELGLLDDDFRKLIPNLSLKAKQVTRSFYDTMDVFWGPTFSRANILSSNVAPFNVGLNESFTVTIDGTRTITVTTMIGDIATPGQATAEEMVRFFNKIEGVTAEIFENPTNGEERINLRTNTPGPRGSLEIDPMASMPGVGFVPGVRHRITDLEQRTVVYQVNPGELIIELPATVPTLRRTLKGSHHFHADATLEPVIPPATIPWVGSFMYSTFQQPYVVTANKAILDQTILKGSVLSQITVQDTSQLDPLGGELVFDYGKENEEARVKYITITNANTILIDPGHVWTQTHQPGSEVNRLLDGQITPYAPRKNGDDYAIYLTSPANARAVVQELIKTLAAAGITIRFIILLPEYKYLFSNPFID